MQESPSPRTSSSPNEQPGSKILCCSKCKAKFADLISLQAHFLDQSDCFCLMTTPYLVRNPGNTWICQICKFNFSSEKSLKRHCFSQTTCKLSYINLFTPSMNDGEGIKGCMQAYSMSLTGTIPPNFLYYNTSTATTSPITEPMETKSAHVGNGSLIPQSTFLDVGVASANEDGVTKTCTLTAQDKELILEKDKTTRDKTFIPTGVRSHSADTPRCSIASYGDSQSPTFPKLVRRKQLRSKNLKDHPTCKGCLRRFDSSKQLKKHQSASVRCKRIIEQLERTSTSCIECGQTFLTVNAKFTHIITSPICKEFLRKAFENGQFYNSTEFFQNCAINSSMCNYCLFTPNDGNIFSHLLSSNKCWMKFETAILRYTMTPATEDTSIASPTIENGLAVSKEFACGDCERSFYNKRSLISHKAKRHRSSSCLEQGPASSIRKSEHLYCFKCKRYLKTENDVTGHMCEHTRLMSALCKSSAVWQEGGYQCKLCTELFFNCRNALKNHMYTHEKNKSRLFIYVQTKSRQPSKTHATPMMGDTSNGVEHKEQAASIKAMKCGHCDKMFYTGREFKHHILTVNDCLKFYEHPRSECPMTDTGCYICTRNY